MRPGAPATGGPRPQAGGGREFATRALVWFFELFPGLARPVVIVMSVIAMGAALVLFWLGAGMFVFGAVFGGLMIGGFGMICYWTALAWMLTGFIASPVECLLEFDGLKWTFLFVATGLPLGVIAVLPS